MLTFVKKEKYRIVYQWVDLYAYSTHNNKGVQRSEARWFKIHEKGTLIAISMKQRLLLELLYTQYMHNKLNQMYLLMREYMINDVVQYLFKMIIS